jgi:hypothetical protein
MGFILRFYVKLTGFSLTENGPIFGGKTSTFHSGLGGRIKDLGLFSLKIRKVVFWIFRPKN